jgi:hypothetical protein
MGYQAVMRLARDPNLVINRPWHPKKLDWLDVVKGCYEEAKRLDGRSFSGSMIVARVGWFPGLTKLERYGILERDDTLSDKTEIWWIVPDIDGVRRALRELGYL